MDYNIGETKNTKCSPVLEQLDQVSSTMLLNGTQKKGCYTFNFTAIFFAETTSFKPGEIVKAVICLGNENV